MVTALDVPVLCEVMVAPKCREIGLGSSLAFESVRAIRERGPGELHAVISSHDLRALRLLRRLGFEPVDRPTVGLWVHRVALGVPPPRRE